jgi:hypothetical protein
MRLCCIVQTPNSLSREFSIRTSSQTYREWKLPKISGSTATDLIWLLLECSRVSEICIKIVYLRDFICGNKRALIRPAALLHAVCISHTVYSELQTSINWEKYGGSLRSVRYGIGLYVPRLCKCFTGKSLVSKAREIYGESRSRWWMHESFDEDSHYAATDFTLMRSIASSLSRWNALFPLLYICFLAPRYAALRRARSSRRF